jgi:hypothetical protein
MADHIIKRTAFLASKADLAINGKKGGSKKWADNITDESRSSNVPDVRVRQNGILEQRHCGNKVKNPGDKSMSALMYQLFQ